MAKQFTIPFKTFYGTGCTIDIYVEGYSGSVEELKAGVMPFVVENSRSSVVSGANGLVETFFKINAISSSDLNNTSLQSEQYGDIWFEYKEEDVLKYKGVISPFDTGSPYEGDGYYTLSIGAEIGLNELKSKELRGANGSILSGRVRLIDVISLALKSLTIPNTFNIKSFVSLQTYTGSTEVGVDTDFFSRYVDAETFRIGLNEWMSCYQALETVLSGKFDLYFDNESWVLDYPLNSLASTRNITTYNSNGSYISRINEVIEKPTINNATVKRGGNEGRLFSKKNIKIEHKISSIINKISNPNFEFSGFDILDWTSTVSSLEIGGYGTQSEPYYAKLNGSVYSPTTTADTEYLESEPFDWYPVGRSDFEDRELSTYYDEDEKLKFSIKSEYGNGINGSRVQIIAIYQTIRPNQPQSQINKPSPTIIYDTKTMYYTNDGWSSEIGWYITGNQSIEEIEIAPPPLRFTSTLSYKALPYIRYDVPSPAPVSVKIRLFRGDRKKIGEATSEVGGYNYFVKYLSVSASTWLLSDENKLKGGQYEYVTSKKTDRDSGISVNVSMYEKVTPFAFGSIYVDNSTTTAIDGFKRLGTSNILGWLDFVASDYLRSNDSRLISLDLPFITELPYFPSQLFVYQGRLFRVHDFEKDVAMDNVRVTLHEVKYSSSAVSLKINDREFTEILKAARPQRYRDLPVQDNLFNNNGRIGLNDMLFSLAQINDEGEGIIFGDAIKSNAGILYLQKEGKEGTNGIYWTDSLNENTDYIRPETDGFKFKSETSPYEVTLDFTELTANTRLIIPPLSGDSSLVTSETGWLLNGNALTASKSIGSTTDYDVSVIRNNVTKVNFGATTTDFDAATYNFKNGGTTYATLNSTGLGIGVNPTNKFHVLSPLSTVAMIESSASQAFYGLKSNTGGVVYFGNKNGGDFTIQTAGSGYSDKFYVTSSGNVGIGTASPKVKVDIRGTNEAIPSLASTPSGSLLIGSNVTSAAISIGVFGGNYAYLQYRGNTGDGGSYPFVINPLGGNVGIGTTNPLVKLMVAGDIMAGATNKIGFNYNTSDANFYNFIEWHQESRALNIAGGMWTSSATQEAIRFSTQQGVKMSILNNGDVGIGTTSPSEKLDVNGTIKATGLKLPTGAVTGYVLKVTDGATGATAWQEATIGERWKGNWDASSGVAPSATPTVGDYYSVIVTGDFGGVNFPLNSYAYYNGTSWVFRPNGYTLATASASVLGGIRVGSGLSIDGSGILSRNALVASDIPSLDWSKITTGKPTTISGYGITDAYTKSEVYTKSESDGRFVHLEGDEDINGIKTFLTDIRVSNNQIHITEDFLNRGGSPASYGVLSNKLGAGGLILDVLADGGAYFRTGTTRKALFDTNGLILSGTLANADVPTERLHVVGNIRYSGTLKPNNAQGTAGQFLKNNGVGNADTWATIGHADISDLSSFTGFDLRYIQTIPSISLATGVNGILPIANGGTGSSIQNFVDLTTNQDISGDKRFYGSILLSDGGASLSSTGFSTLLSSNTSALSLRGSFIRHQISTSDRMVVYDAGVRISNFVSNNYLQTPTERLQVEGNIRYNNLLKPNNIAGTNKQVLSTNGTQDLWVTLGLSYMSDVSITSPVGGSVLIYDNMLSKWVSQGSQFLSLHSTQIINALGYTPQPSGSYLTGNQTITLSGIVTGSGTTAITTAIADNALSIAKTSGLQSALNAKQATLNGTGFIKASGTTITYDNREFVDTSTTQANISGNKTFLGVTSFGNRGGLIESVSFSGGTDGGTRFTGGNHNIIRATNYIRLQPSGADRAILTNTGLRLRAYVGTDEWFNLPSEMLHIDGNIRVSGVIKPDNVAPTAGQFLKGVDADNMTWAGITTGDITDLSSYTGFNSIYQPIGDYLTTTTAAGTYQPILPSGSSGQFLVKDSDGNNNFMRLELEPQGLSYNKIAVGDSANYLAEHDNFEFREGRYVAIYRNSDPTKAFYAGMFGNSNNSYITASGGSLVIKGDSGIYLDGFTGFGNRMLIVDGDGRVKEAPIPSGGGTGTTTLGAELIGFGSPTNTVTGVSRFKWVDNRFIKIDNAGTSNIEIGRKFGTDDYGLFVSNGNLELSSSANVNVSLGSTSQFKVGDKLRYYRNTNSIQLDSDYTAGEYLTIGNPVGDVFWINAINAKLSLSGTEVALGSTESSYMTFQNCKINWDTNDCINGWSSGGTPQEGDEVALVFSGGEFKLKRKI